MFKELAAQARSAVLVLLLLTALTGLGYPLLITGLGQALFPHQANGSLVRNEQGEVIGSELIGQGFTQPQYFHPRPSAAGADGYNAASSSGSNLGPTNQNLIELVEERTLAYREENRLAEGEPVPVDAVTASGSGLDPHISPANAFLQVRRVAEARGLPEAEVRALVEGHIEGRSFGILGGLRVNVLKLNLALDNTSQR
jgi:K+-transporting ATPase ATPase C chain